MKLSAPKAIIWWIALLVAVAAILVNLGILNVSSIPVLKDIFPKYVFWAMTGAYGLLFLGTLLKGL